MWPGSAGGQRLRVALYKGTISFERTAVRTPKNIIPMDSTEKITMGKSAYVIAGGYVR
jgi:hypothetical protein